MMTIMESSEGSDADEGDVIDISEHATVLAAAAGSGGALSISADNSTPLTGSDQLKVIYAATKDVANNNAAKTLRRSRGLQVTSTANATAGSSASNDSPSFFNHLTNVDSSTVCPNCGINIGFAYFILNKYRIYLPKILLVPSFHDDPCLNSKKI